MVVLVGPAKSDTAFFKVRMTDRPIPLSAQLPNHLAQPM